MRLKTCISLLVLVQAVLLLHMLIIIDGSADGAATSIQALPGHVTQVTVFPQTAWGGVWGTLLPDGENDVSISAGYIASTNIAYNDEDNNCSRTELIAAVIGVDPALVGPVDPVYADGILGLDSRSPFSAQAMFDTPRTFQLGPNTVELWSTETQGELGPFIQGIGLAGANLVFVTQTKRNAQNYAGEPANYQLLLPAGNWQIVYDESDSCSLLDEIITQERTDAPSRLDIAVPQRVCVGEENTIHSVAVRERTFCRPSEIGAWYCEAVPDATITISAEGVELYSITSGENGEASFTPTKEGEYMLRATTQNGTASRLVRADECLDPTLGLLEGRTIEYAGIDITAPEQTFPGQPTGPQIIEDTLKAEFVLIAWITVLVFVLGSVAFYKQHKDDSILLLRLRIIMYRLRG